MRDPLRRSHGQGAATQLYNLRIMRELAPKVVPSSLCTIVTTIISHCGFPSSFVRTRAVDSLQPHKSALARTIWTTIHAYRHAQKEPHMYVCTK